MARLAGNLDYTAAKAAALLNHISDLFFNAIEALPDNKIEFERARDLNFEASKLAEELTSKSNGVFASVHCDYTDALRAARKAKGGAQ